MSDTLPLKAVFLDFDGVLVDSVPTKTRAFATLFAPYGQAAAARVVDYHKRHGGISRLVKIRYGFEVILGAELSDETFAALCARYAGLVVDEVIRAREIAGATEFLRRQQGRVLLFLVSGTPQNELEHIVHQRGLAGFFAEICGSPTTKPVHILRLLEQFRLDRRHCVFVGDALTDYHAARETGLAFIGIQGELPFPAGTTVLADCRSLEEALAVVFRW